MRFLQIVARSWHLLRRREKVLSRWRLKCRSPRHTKQRVRSDPPTYFVLARSHLIVSQIILEPMNTRSKELQTLGPGPRLKTRCIGCVMPRTGDNIFIVDFVWLEVVLNATVIEETRLVAEPIARQKHTLGLFVQEFVRIV